MSERRRRRERDRRRRSAIVSGAVVVWFLAVLVREVSDAFAGEPPSMLRVVAGVILTGALALAVVSQPDP